MATKTTYQLMVKLGAATSPSWKKTLNSAEAYLSNLNSIGNKVAAGVAAGVTAASATAVMAVSDAVDTYVGFESELATVKSISRATERQFLELKEAALEAGRSTVFTAEESAAALEYMSLASWDVNESIAGLPLILKMAAATGKELKTTSDLVTDSMSALGLEVLDLDMYLDKLVAGNNEANNTSEELMEGLIESGGAARTLGADLDDTITALGKLADNGKKGAAGGTALNAIMTRLAGNTTALKELDKLNVDIWDDDGKFIGFEESLIRINDALSNLTDENRALSMKNIAGTNYFSEMSYLLDAVREVTDENGNVVSAWQELETEVSESTGALENMYDVTTDTLLFAQKRLTSAKEDMQIRVTDVFADDAKDFLIWLSESMPNATDAIVDFAEAHKGEFADALEKVGEGIEMLWENGIAAGQWVIRHKGALLGGLKGIAAGFVGIKAALAGVKIVELFSNPLAAVTAGAGLAVAGIGAVAGAIRDAETAAVNADLAEHFGSISLSMSEIEDVAKRITESGYLNGVAAALEEFDELGSISDKIDEEVKTLEKLNWKVSIGLELTEGEQEEYQRAIESFVENAQEYALQAQYSVSLIMDLDYVDSLEQSDITGKINQFYADKYQELSDLGTKLKDAVTDAFNDDLLKPDEIGTIARIQADMAKIEQELAVGESEASLSLLEMEYSGQELTPETFQRLMEELDANAAEATEAYKAAYKDRHSAATAAYNGGYLTDEEYETELQEINDEYTRATADFQMRNMQFLINTLNGVGYTDEYQNTVSQVLDEYTIPVMDEFWDPQSTADIFGTVTNEISSRNTEMEKVMARLLEPMESSFDEIYALRGQWDNLTPEMQQTLEKMYADMDQLMAMAGDKKALSSDLGRKIEDAEGYDKAKEYVDYYYEDLVEHTKTSAEIALEKGMDTAKTEAESIVDGTYSYMQYLLDNTFSKGFQTSFDLTLYPQIKTRFPQIEDELDAQEYRSRTQSTSGRAKKIMHNAEGGIYSSPILTTFAEEGPEAAVPLDGSARAKSIWARAGEILGMLPQGNRDRVLLDRISGGQQESRTGKTFQLSYSPVITIQGNASKEDVQSALAINLDDLREMIKELQREEQRTSFMG
ncbi:MAG: phage tail tape measure protein [Firmicutes bacterium]|nr:phage tail tape measure protein [Bacillota bacterium]